MTTKPRLDLTGMQPGDAEALRRFAYVVERGQKHRHHPGWWKQLLAGVGTKVVTGLARGVADRLDAGDVKP